MTKGHRKATLGPRVPKSGLNVARKTLPNGDVREYFYHYRSGTPLGNDRQAAIETAKKLDQLIGVPVVRDTPEPERKVRELVRGILQSRLGQAAHCQEHGCLEQTAGRAACRGAGSPTKANETETGHEQTLYPQAWDYSNQV
jgi:hypothetical protein